MSDRSPSRLQVALVVGFHICTALAVTIINKAVLNTLPVPVVLLLSQSVMSIAFIHLGSLLKLYTLPKLDYNFVRGLVPLLAMKSIAQLSKTYCLLVWTTLVFCIPIQVLNGSVWLKRASRH